MVRILQIEMNLKHPSGRTSVEQCKARALTPCPGEINIVSLITDVANHTATASATNDTATIGTVGTFRPPYEQRSTRQ